LEEKSGQVHPPSGPPARGSGGDVSTLARNLLRGIKGHVPDLQTIDLVPLTVGELRSLCSTVVRLQAYLDWADEQAELQWEYPLDEYPRGYVEANKDVRTFVLEGKLEQMLLEEGSPDPAAALRELGVGS